jgi:hypothetical protein
MVAWYAGHAQVTGRKLNTGAALPLRAQVSNGYGSSGFQPSGLTFPTTGCWRVLGKVGAARLAFTVEVTKIKPDG